MIGEADVGRRVVVRRVVGERDGRPLFSDVLGQLIRCGPDGVTVRDRTGRQVDIPFDQVDTAKVVPPRRASTRDIVALERVAAAGWPAPDTDRLGDWLLRAAGGWTGRANSALVLGDPARPLDAALSDVRDWYDRRGLRALLALPLPAFHPLDPALRQRGWTVANQVLVQTSSLAGVLARAPAAPPVAPSQNPPTDVAREEPDNPLPVQLADEPGDDWLDVVASRKGGPSAAALAVLTGPPRTVFASVFDAERLVAVGRGVLDGAWLGLSLVEVAPAARHRGLARHVVRHLTRWAAKRGATSAYLQVDEGNAAAVGLHAGLGFSTHHRYAVYAAPGAGRPPDGQEPDTTPA